MSYLSKFYCFLVAVLLSACNYGSQSDIGSLTVQDKDSSGSIVLTNNRLSNAINGNLDLHYVTASYSKVSVISDLGNLYHLNTNKNVFMTVKNDGFPEGVLSAYAVDNMVYLSDKKGNIYSSQNNFRTIKQDNVGKSIALYGFGSLDDALLVAGYNGNIFIQSSAYNKNGSGQERDWFNIDLGGYSLYSIASDGNDTLLAVGNSGVIWRSFDRGAHWNKILVEGVISNLYQVRYVNGDFYIAGDYATLLKSSDHGLTWKKINFDNPWLTTKHFKGITTVWNGNLEKIIAVGTGGLIVSSVNNGVSWQVESSGVVEHLLSVDCTDERTNATCYATSGNVILSSIDKGHTWHTLNIQDEQVKFKDIVSSEQTKCALDSSGQAYCWGSNMHGECGSNSALYSISEPVKVAQDHDVRFNKIVAGYLYFCGLTKQGKAYCWGNGSHGQLGNGTSLDIKVPTLVHQPKGVEFSDLFAGFQTICGLTKDGQAYCWGRGTNGQIGNANKNNVNIPTKVSQPLNINFKSLVIAQSTVCGLTNAGQTYCWGSGYNGQIGDDSLDSSTIPIKVHQSDGVKFNKLYVSPVDTGIDSTFCGLTTNGIAYCWGYGMFGQIGNGKSINAYEPAAVIDPSVRNKYLNFQKLFIGYRMGCGLTVDGQAYCWGSNEFGKIGDGGSYNSVNYPVKVAQPHDVRFNEIITNANTLCGLTASGQAYCWGHGVHGEIGNGSMINVSSPTKVSQSLGIVFSKLTVNHYFGASVCGLTMDGDAYCWGNGETRANGNASNLNLTNPTRITMPILFYE